MLAQIQDRDVRTFTGVQRRHRSADAAVRPGYQGDLSLEASGSRITRLPIGLRLQLALVAWQLILVDHRLHNFGHGLLLRGDA